MTEVFTYCDGVLHGLDGVDFNLYLPEDSPADKHVWDAFGPHLCHIMNDAYNWNPELFCAMSDEVAAEVTPELERGERTHPAIELFKREFRATKAACDAVEKARTSSKSGR